MILFHFVKKCHLKKYLVSFLLLDISNTEFAMRLLGRAQL